MKTSKPISTISYNTDEFIRNKIEYWRSCGIIEFGMWIRHEAEADEKKSHCHVYLKPAKLIQTMDLEMDSCEIDPTNPEKPLKMVSFRISTESDWLLYSLHDKAYLLEKGLERQFHYDISDIQSTCDDTLQDIITQVSDKRKGSIEYRILDMVNKGMTWQQIVSSGMIPLRYMGGAKIMYQALTGQAAMI